MIIKNLGIIVVDTNRGRAYIQNLAKNELFPSFILVLEQKSNGKKKKSKYAKEFFDANEPVTETLKKYKLKFKNILAESCNEYVVISELKSRKEKYFIYTGGGILKKEILSIGKKFIHIHPGTVPYYRGSTCMYYSIINEKKLGATAFFLETGLDKGDIIAQKEYQCPKILDMDNIYDPWMRSDLLVDIVKKYSKTGKFESRKQNKKAGETYFIIHPVLKHLAILMCRKSLLHTP